MTRRAAHNVLKSAFMTAGLNGHLTTHSLRKSFAQRLYEQTGDVFTVQEMLGHKSIATMQKYLGVNYASVREAVQKMSLDSDILTIAWKPLEYIGADSEHSGDKRLKVELRTLFPCLPERSRFNRRRRNLSETVSEVVARALLPYLPKSDVCLVDSFPRSPICDVKRAEATRSDLKWEEASGTLATYGHCATKSLGTFFGFRRHLITTAAGIPIDVAIASAHRDD